MIEYDRTRSRIGVLQFFLQVVTRVVLSLELTVLNLELTVNHLKAPGCIRIPRVIILSV